MPPDRAGHHVPESGGREGAAVRAARLSEREIEVTRHVAEGATNAEIADQLMLSVRTVQAHVSRAMRRAGGRNRAHLAALAIWGGRAPEPPT